jgi:hypothetical protein
MNEYGEENFIIEKLIKIKNNDLLLKLERMYIEKFKSYEKEFGFNYHSGNPQKLSKERRELFIEHPDMRKKISDSTRKSFEEHPERRKNLSDFTRINMTGRKNALGHILSEESRKKISIANKKYWARKRKLKC